MCNSVIFYPWNDEHKNLASIKTTFSYGKKKFYGIAGFQPAGTPNPGSLDSVPSKSCARSRNSERHLEHVFKFLRRHRQRLVRVRRQRGLAEPLWRLRWVRKRSDEPKLRNKQTGQILKRFEFRNRNRLWIYFRLKGIFTHPIFDLRF